MITWLITKEKSYRIEDQFQPSFFVYSSKDNLFTLASQLHEDPSIKHLNFTHAKLQLGSEKKYVVLEVIPKTITSISALAEKIDAQGKYHTYTLYNVDIRLPTRYLQSNGVFSNAWVTWDKGFILKDNQWSIDYDVPAFTIAHLSLKKKTGLIAWTDPLTHLVVDDTVISEENEADTILQAVRVINKKDPDIIYTAEGDSFLFPYLYQRAKDCGILHAVEFGREKNHKKTPSKQAKSYFSYGQIVYRPAFYTLKGRVHIDTKSSFMYSESRLRGIVDISRCANIPLQLQARLGPGTAISQIQVNNAMQKGYLIPWKKNMPENCKTAKHLLLADRGGLILSPKTGLYDNVVELDFASLYPNIMLRFNISPETMLCDCCHDSSLTVPQLGYHICTKKTGLLPEVLKPIIYRRFLYKARSHNKKYDAQLYSDIQQAWKWLLIVCFGYTGYRNARYGRIECHESITAFARDILLKALRVAEHAGYRVLHGIVDSLWIQATSPSIDPQKISRRISETTGIKMDVEGRYKWIVFLPSKQHDVGALTRYYGVFDTGKMKVRGIELRQRNTPEFLKEVQQSMLDVLCTANTSQEFHGLIPQALHALCCCALQLINNDINPYKLVFTTRISKAVTEYKVNTLVKSALLQMRDLGFNVQPGQSLSYLVLNEQTREYKSRVKVLESITGDEQVDIEYYLRQMAQCAESILVPFGYTRETLEIMLKELKYTEVKNASILSRDRAVQTSL